MSRNIILNFFENALAQHGNSTRSLGYSELGQKRRFEALLSQDNFNDRTLLDFGCGLGHLRLYALERFPQCRYVGIDISEKMIAAAKESQPDGDFRCTDVLARPLVQPVDYIASNGIDNLETGKNEQFARYMMRTLFAQCRIGLLITMLSNRADKKDGASHYFDPLQMLQEAFAITPYVTFRHDYAANDFALFLYHEPRRTE